MEFEEHKKRQERARELGMDYARIREIITSAHSDDEDGISMGRAVEEIRELALQAVEKAIEEERADVLAYLRYARAFPFTYASNTADIIDALRELVEQGQHAGWARKETR